MHEDFKAALLQRDPTAVLRCVEDLRGKGIRYFEAMEIAKQLDETIQPAEFDALIQEGEYLEEH